jgi:hypothetical protein
MEGGVQADWMLGIGWIGRQTWLLRGTLLLVAGEDSCLLSYPFPFSLSLDLGQIAAPRVRKSRNKTCGCFGIIVCLRVRCLFSQLSYPHPFSIQGPAEGKNLIICKQRIVVEVSSPMVHFILGKRRCTAIAMT